MFPSAVSRAQERFYRDKMREKGDGEGNNLNGESKAVVADIFK